MPRHFPIGVDLYFPNIVFRLIRAHLPPHEAAFKVPTHLNKLDIKNYLESLYKIKVHHVTTSIKTGKTTQNARGVQIKQSDWKRAIVTMEDDFVWPGLPDKTTSGAQYLPDSDTKPFGKSIKPKADK